MTTDVPLKCKCGKMTGVLRNAHDVSRLVCYCRSCQAYAYKLERSADMMDAHGGTEIAQTTPSQIELQSGQDNLRCLRLTPKGALRWYAGCCNTPIANTLDNSRMAFAAISQTFVDLKPEETERLWGDIKHRVNGRHSHGNPSGAHDGAPISMIAGTFFRIGWASLRGRAKPSIFFAGSEPTVSPELETKDSYEALRERAKQAPQP